MKLNLFCNANKIDGWVNVDYLESCEPDVVADLEKPWPWEDGSADYIRAYDGPEHVIDPIHFMNEAFRVLKDGGVIEVWVPSTDGRGAFQDPTHKSFWNAHSFYYYTPGNICHDLYPDITAEFDWKVYHNGNDPFSIIHILAFGLKGEVWTDDLHKEVFEESDRVRAGDAAK